MNIPISVDIPDLWGGKSFAKNEWGPINYLVGPNGSGKTRFADQLKGSLSRAQLKPRYLSAERLAGLEKASSIMGHSSAIQNGFNIGSFARYKEYGANQGIAADAFVILKEKLNVRIKIEAFLSSIFERRIRFAEEGGFLKPKIQRIRGGSEYGMKESECHGLKELIALLAFIYDDEFKSLIIDEPELHLHPQFQTFLLAELRRAAGDPRSIPNSKVIFLITHSPYLLDFRTLDDLRNCLLFHPKTPPTSINVLQPQDEYSLKRLLPRLNTHHKQFFFAHRPIFVEGYTDQQMFTLIQDSRSKLMGATGACFIDVNGKEEQDFFYRLCRQLEIDAQFIADLDVLTRGSFRNSISEDPRCKTYCAAQGIAPNLMDAIRDLNGRLDALIHAFGTLQPSTLPDLSSALQVANDIESKRYAMLVAVVRQKSLLEISLPARVSELNYVVAKLNGIRAAAQEAGVFILPHGALENHAPSYRGSIYAIPDKAKATTFEQERDFILDASDSTAVETRYSELIPLLDAACGTCDVDLKLHLSYAIGTFIGSVQMAFQRREIDSMGTLQQHALVDWKTFSRILEGIEFVTSDHGFKCRMKLQAIVDQSQTEFEFDDDTVHAKFAL